MTTIQNKVIMWSIKIQNLAGLKKKYICIYLENKSWMKI